MGRPALVCWTIAMPDRTYRVGLSFNGRSTPGRLPENAGTDYYDALQLSPMADQDTIHRVFRILAQRYHPDNQETGNEEQFKNLLAAYQVLSNPEQRAAYDARRLSADPGRWRIFSSFKATQGVESERRKRKGILALLYARRVLQPEQPHMTLREMEELLGCPREHLEFSLWYLKENALVARTDNARYSITAKGVDRAEKVRIQRPLERPLITAREVPTR
jgi:curved DNA-binding protein CbpA